MLTGALQTGTRHISQPTCHNSGPVAFRVRNLVRRLRESIVLGRTRVTMFFTTSVYDWAGYAGVSVYLGAYICLQLGLIRGSGYRYALLNMIAAIFVLISLSAEFNLASAII
ncbi:CBU_0592 family membrane protein [Roseovarius nitratireducens]|uniref:CBU_0592 family membrane protein n=1 Tax=Roseovarius nitratireducens TaxID=2044597 RepID=UPI000CE21F2C|nr:hypothetical protein [Roseovarius nitratireducens]